MHHDLVLASGAGLHGLQRLTVRTGRPGMPLPLDELGERGQTLLEPVGAGHLRRGRGRRSSGPSLGTAPASDRPHTTGRDAARHRDDLGSPARGRCDAPGRASLARCCAAAPALPGRPAGLAFAAAFAPPASPSPARSPGAPPSFGRTAVVRAHHCRSGGRRHPAGRVVAAITHRVVGRDRAFRARSGTFPPR